MVYNSLTCKDLKRRVYFKQIEEQRKSYKIILQNLRISRKVRTHFFCLDRQLVLKFKNVNVLSRIKNRCILTGRGRSIYRDFRLSRMQIRHWASFGYLVGVKKSSW